jgi:indole-3-acetate monooxygenase
MNMGRENLAGSPAPIPETVRESKSAIAPVFGGAGALLEAIRRLTPEITRRTAEIEAARALPDDLFQKIAATGILRAVRPTELGGAEYRLPDMIPVLEELGRADASTAWSFMIASSAPIVWQRLDRKLLHAVFSSNPDALTRAGVTPKPGVTKIDGGLMVNGRWPLLSGSYKPDWIFIGGIVSEKDGAPAKNAEGQPDVRFVFLPASDVKILDTWDSIGLRSTESHDVTIENKLVSENWSVPYSKTNDDGPRIGRLPHFLATGPFHLGVVLGIARGILDEIIALAQTKRPFLNPSAVMAKDPLFQFRIGGLETRLAAARRFAIAESEEAWAFGAEKERSSSADRMRFRAMTAHVHSECMALANEVFGLAGTNVLYNTSSLQRRFRDMRAVCQHVVANTDIFSAFGAILLRQ